MEVSAHKEARLTNRQRFIKICHCEKTDRVPNVELGPWKQTIARWKKEGLPLDVPGGLWLFDGVAFFGLEPVISCIKWDLGPVPRYQDSILEETDRYIIKVDPDSGCTRKMLKEGSIDGMRMSMDTYYDFVVKDRDSFLENIKRYNPDSAERYPLSENLKDCNTRHTALSAIPFGSNCPGFYAILRKWMGTENTSFAFYDQPGLVHEILDFWVDFLIGCLDGILKSIKPDFYHIFEDFAGKGGPLFSPKLFDEFFAPRYRKLISYLHSRGINTVTFDSDGDISVLMSRLIDAGVNMIFPIEIAAGMDPVEIRKKYGNSISMLGGIDKLEIMKGKEAIKRELDKKLPYLLRQGGYIPTMDHAIPPELSLEDFLYYLELKEDYLR